MATRRQPFRRTLPLVGRPRTVGGMPLVVHAESLNYDNPTTTEGGVAAWVAWPQGYESALRSRMRDAQNVVDVLVTFGNGGDDAPPAPIRRRFPDCPSPRQRRDHVSIDLLANNASDFLDDDDATDDERAAIRGLAVATLATVLDYVVRRRRAVRRDGWVWLRAVAVVRNRDSAADRAAFERVATWRQLDRLALATLPGCTRPSTLLDGRPLDEMFKAVRKASRLRRVMHHYRTRIGVRDDGSPPTLGTTVPMMAPLADVLTTLQRQ
jgi:hypothetical protein